jgi:hypothetical protein
MAAAFFNKLVDPSKARALSAGTTPGDRVHRLHPLRQQRVLFRAHRSQRRPRAIHAGAFCLGIRAANVPVAS